MFVERSLNLIDMKKLSGKKAIITGASRNIGAEIALQFAKEGADVLLHYNSDKNGINYIKNKIEQLGRKAFILQADFSSQSSVKSFIDKAIDLLGSVDILVNNASEYDTSHILDLKIENFKSLLEVGLVAPSMLLKLAALNMIKNNNGGSIINISSISGLRTCKNRVAHSATKSGLNMMTKGAALDLGEYGIRVNAICPGPVPYDEGGEYMVENIPLVRAGKPQDIANAALFLASSDSSWVTGHTMVVDGGYSLAH